MLPSSPMSLVIILLHLSPADAREGESLELVESEMMEDEAAQKRRLGEPVFLLAYVLLAGLGVLTAMRTKVEE